MADEQSKNNNIKLMKGRVQTISKDEILEVTGKGKPFTLSKDLINNKQEYLSDKFTPLVPNDVFALSNSEDSTKHEGEFGSPNAALLKFVKPNGEYLRTVVNGTTKDIIFSEKLNAFKELPSKTTAQIASEEKSIIQENRNEYSELCLYTSKLMFVPPTTKCEKVLESYPFIRKVKES